MTDLVTMHTHSTFCGHAKDPLSAVVDAAAQAGRGQDLRDAVGRGRGGHADDAVAFERSIADHVGQYVIGNVEVARYRIVHGIPFTARGCRARQKTC